ncbi:MAG: MATE family efflux transporter [Propionibacteriaceae bacterium]|nr:MATE family efflux transporter [Propionibacteriaceae bacterium]
MLTPVDRRLLALAVPTLGALLAQPVFVLIDTAMIGHLSTVSLAGLGVAATLASTVVGLLVFLAYQTTASVARLIGAGDLAGGLRTGWDGVWAGTLIGLAAASGLAWFGKAGARALGADEAVASEAASYLLAAAPGVVGTLVIFAATGTLRGLSSVRVVLAVEVAGAIANIGLNAVFIYGLGLGVAGSGLGTSVAQLGMAAAFLVVMGKKARLVGVSLRPRLSGLRGVGRAGWPLFVRTVSLRLSILATVWAAAGLGLGALSGHQIVVSVWSFSAFALDAVAIAAQTLVGESLGASDGPAARALLRRCLGWGIGGGALLGAVIAAGTPWLVLAFTSDASVTGPASGALWVAAAGLPLAGLVYVLDGVLIGAGDGRYLAWSGVLNLLAYLPVLAALVALAPGLGLPGLWVAYCAAFMGARAVTLGARARTDRWLVLGR